MSDVVTRSDRALMFRAGYGRRGGAGRRPALLVVDVTYEFCGEPGQRLDDAVRECRNACGPAAWSAVAVIEELLASSRRAAAPVAFTRSADRASGPPRAAKNARALTDPPLSAHHRSIVAAITPRDGELVVEKTAPSAFFDTDLHDRLSADRVDSLVVCGGATSGCVRATVVDGHSHGYFVTVVGAACFDRLAVSHEVALFEMDQKYADLVNPHEAGTILQRAVDRDHAA